MKKLKTIFMMLLALVAFASCSDDDDNSEKMTNYVTLAINGSNILYEDATEGVDVTVSLAYAVEEESTITLSLKGNENGAVKLSSETLTFAKGEKTATVQVLSNNANVLGAQEVVT
nr:DUF4929 family protein [Bacteroidaceae bacterium]